MTRRRDRYQSAFDWGDPRGVSAAGYDLMLALMLLDRYMSEHGLQAQTVTIGVKDKRTYMIADLLDIAEAARRQSIDPALNVYQQLQVNAEAADALAQVFDVGGPSDFSAMRDALSATLN